VKVLGGRDVKTSRRWRNEPPGGGEIPRGARRSDGPNRPSEIGARVAGSKALEPGANLLVRSSGRRRAGGNGRRATVGENPARLCGNVEPLKGKPCTWLRDGTSPQRVWRSKPSRAGGTPRTERSEELGSPRGEWTPHTDVAKRALATHRGALVAPVTPSGVDRANEGRRQAERTLKRTLGSWENEPDRQTSGDGRWDLTEAENGNVDASGRCANPIGAACHLLTTLRGAGRNLMRGMPSPG